MSDINDSSPPPNPSPIDLSNNTENQANPNNFNLLLDLLANSKQSAPSDLSGFPLEYDFSQPAKSWWRYFKKQPERNTAMCLTCGAVFNRGPKQSTTSLSHHLKMYHREQFILIQQAKDEDIRQSGRQRGAKRRGGADSGASATAVERQQPIDYSYRKKSAFNVALIRAVKDRPHLYDAARQSSPDGRQTPTTAWDEIASQVGTSAQNARKAWNGLCQRYKKEFKIALRDNFAYQPKWPYFNEFAFMDEQICNESTATGQAVGARRCLSNSSANSSEYSLQSLSYLNAPDAMTGALLSNILSVACAQSPSPHMVDEENASTDSAIASSSSDQGHSSAEATDPSLHTGSTLFAIQQFLSARSEDAESAPNKEVKPEPTDEGAQRRARPRKSAPARIQQSTVSSSSLGTGERRSFDWLDDEDQLFGKIIALRLRTLGVDAKRKMKILIEQLFERQERGLTLPQSSE